jgi:hypothetical protein
MISSNGFLGERQSGKMIGLTQTDEVPKESTQSLNDVVNLFRTSKRTSSAL